MQASKSYQVVTQTFLQPSAKLLPPCNSQFRRNININTNTIRATSIPIQDNRILTQKVDDKAIPIQDNRILTQKMDEKIMAFWDYQSLFTSQRLEVENPIKLRLIDGTFPKDFPSGTYYLTGPGLFADDYGSTIHPLDGHGYVRAFEFDGSKREVRFSAKYVKTEAQMEECDQVSGSWKFSHRGPFSVLKGGKMIANTKVMKNVANTSILKWGGRLFCLWEGGIPYEIDPKTLDTIGSFNLINDDELGCHKEGSIGRFHAWDVVANLLKPILYGVFKMPPKRLLSHYKVDAQRGRLIIMTCNAEDMVLPLSHCTFYEFDMDFNLLQKREFNIPDHLMIHDWAFTHTHYVLFANCVKLDILEMDGVSILLKLKVWKWSKVEYLSYTYNSFDPLIAGSMAAICGLAPMISALSVNYNKRTSPIYILPRFGDNNNFSQNNYRRIPIEVPQLWLLHVANAFEYIDSHGKLMIQIHASTCSYKWFDFQKMFGYNWQTSILDPSTMNPREGKRLLPHLVEVSINLAGNGHHKEFSIARLSKLSKSSDFPIVNPMCSGYRHRYVYAAASSNTCETLPHFPFDTLVKIDIMSKTTHTWSPGDRRFVGEPMFVSTGSIAEDDGYILVIEYVVSHRRCNLLILDPKRLGEGSALVARFEVPKSLTFPLAFHGTWTPKE